MVERAINRFRKIAPSVDFWSIRIVREQGEFMSVRHNVMQPLEILEDAGAMITVYDRGGVGYAATGDLSEGGLKRAADEALNWARRAAGRSVWDFSSLQHFAPQGEYESPCETPWMSIPRTEKIGFLNGLNDRLGKGGRMVEWYDKAADTRTGPMSPFWELVTEAKALLERTGYTDRI